MKRNLKTGLKSEIGRSEIINKTNRIKVENKNIKGSISLEGAIIDDIVFKNYKKTLDSEEKVTFLNPKKSQKEYYIETGWATGGNEKIKLPLSKVDAQGVGAAVTYGRRYGLSAMVGIAQYDDDANSIRK